MSSTSSTSSSTSTSSLFSNNRMGGLMSGLDTESLVKSMAANTKNRLNTKKQKLQTLQWKQEGYRDVISKISSFQEKYISISSSTSIKANAIMSKFTATASDDRIASSAVSTAVPATYTIKAAKAATAATIETSGEGSSANKVTLDFSNAAYAKEYTVNVTLDGTTKEVKFTGGLDADESQANFLKSLNESFSVLKTDDQGFEFTNGSDLIFNDADDGIYHTFSVGYNSEAVGLGNTTASGMANSSALGSIAFATELSADKDGNYGFKINGVEFTFTKDTTISDMVSKINSSDAGVKMTFSSVTQSFKLEATTTGTAGSIEIENTGSNLANALFNTDTTPSKAYGTNGTITISTDGEHYKTYTSASNDYTFDGTTINIGKLGDFDSSEDGVDEITVTTERDTSSIKDVVVNFVNDYNELLSELYTTVNTARPTSSGSYYDPLTEEQEDEMDSDEIEKWNESAKTGLLYHDTYITTFISNLRTAMTTSLNGFSLTDMGIEVSSSLSANGKLTIDESKLDACIKSYGEEVSNFFTDSTNGLAAKVGNTIDKAISTSIKNEVTGKKSYGYLTQLAGIENTASATANTLYSQISSLEKLISTLQDKYEDEMERYWNKFSTLETYMANMQSQSSVFDSSY